MINILNNLRTRLKTMASPVDSDGSPDYPKIERNVNFNSMFSSPVDYPYLVLSKSGRVLRKCKSLVEAINFKDSIKP